MKEDTALTIEFEMEVLNMFTYSNLYKFSNDLVNTIKELEGLKETAVLCQEDKKAVEYQGYIHNATANREAMLVVMMAKEDDVCEHTNIETIWLN